jgi:hypothetical protein
MKYPTLWLALTCYPLVFLVSSCATTNTVQSEKKTETTIVSNPQILFLNYSVSKKSNNRIEVDLINKIVAQGKLKEDVPEHKMGKIGDFKCSEIDENSKLIRSFYITDPLKKNIEYVDGSGQMYRKLVELDSSQFLIRTQLDPRTKFMVISQITDSTPNPTDLITTQIN